MVAAQIGLSVGQFDDMTPRELAIYVEAYNQRLSFEQEQKQREIYASALLISQFVWVKGRKPSYEKVFGGHKPQKEMTDEEMLKAIEALNAEFGGEDLRKEVP